MFSQSIFPLLTLIKVQKTTKYKLFISFPPHYMNKICIFASILKEKYATQYGTGVIGYMEIDGAIIDQSKFAMLTMGAAA